MGWRSHLKFPSKEVLRNVLHEHPIADALFAQLLYEPRFRLLFGVVVFVIAAIPLAIFRIFETSPAGFTPPVKVSAIDLVQAWNLNRTAEQRFRSGRIGEALFTWRMAIANNPADPDLIRAFLRGIPAAKQPQTYAHLAVPYARWLLRLVNDAPADLALAAETYNQLGYPELVIASGKDLGRMEGPFAVGYLKALMRAGEFQRFAETWAQCSSGLDTGSRKSLDLYRAAYFVAAGSPEEKSTAKTLLENARANPRDWLEAHQLLLRVSAANRDLASYQDSLERLTQTGHDLFRDQLGLWELFLQLGRTNEALRLARASGSVPQNPADAILLARFHYLAGEKEIALESLRSCLERFPRSEGAWISYCNLLIEIERWEDLRGAARASREAGFDLRNEMLAYSGYFEALANLRLKRANQVPMLLARVVDYAAGGQSMELAERLLSLGYARNALELLHRKPDFGAGARYWLLLARTAFACGDLEQVEKALRRGHELSPENREIASNLAATLIARGRDPILALDLTSSLLEAGDPTPGLLLNHALALIQNGKVSAAAATLARVAPSNLAAADRNTYHLAQFEIAALGHAPREAEAIAALVRPEDLLPPEAQRFQRMRQALRDPASF